MSEISSEDKLFGTFLRSMDPHIDAVAKSVVVKIDFEKPHIPDKFDPRDPKTSGGSGDGRWKDYLTPIYDQKDCAGCYAYSTISCLSDRFAMQTLLQVKPFFNPLEAVMCYVEENDSESYIQLRDNLNSLQTEEKVHIQKACKGNTIYSMGSYLFRGGAVENKCVPISNLQQMLDKSGKLPLCTSLEGPNEELCLDNNIGLRLWPAYKAYTLQGEGSDLITNLKLELMKWGPISVAFNVFADFLHHYDGKTVYIPKSGQKSLGGHAVKLIGWGSENGVPYWICANSWGVDWGERGYFKIVQGNIDLELESNQMGLYPLLPGVEIIPYTKVNLLITEDDIKKKVYNGVDSTTFYPKRILEEVKIGKLKGDLKPVIDISLVPLTTEFYAYRIGATTFMSYGGQYISSANEHQIKSNHWFTILLIISSSVIIVVLSFLLWKCMIIRHKRV